MTAVDWLCLGLGVAAVGCWLLLIRIEIQRHKRRQSRVMLNALLRSGSLERRSPPPTLDLPSARVVRDRRNGRL